MTSKHENTVLHDSGEDLRAREKNENTFFTLWP